MQSKNISGGQDKEWRIIAMKTEDRYYNDQKRSEVMEAARRLRRKYLRYQQAEIVYSLSRKKTDGTGNRDTLRLWKENIYTDLSDQEKKSLFSGHYHFRMSLLGD